ncbi:MAG: tRNA dihydrouridine(20/20a) synthase DusA [Gammaproteobacteria bacterium]|nr:tRNA dihydrouridine(20/20a) synthase DusA [Gammaproteobacteria bacterium]
MKNFSPNRAFCVAPMMEYTDRFERYFLRLISKRALLYTEMVTTSALLHGDAVRFLRFDAFEQPLALQLGGSDPQALAECAQMAQSVGYCEVNLNVGCPSSRVQSGAIGACLMATPEVVAECVAAMRAVVSIPVTVKTRIGIDRDESKAQLHRFIDRVAEAGCETFIVHARKAWLQGLSPKENRTVPPLRYEVVHELKQERPELEIIINGGLKTLTESQKQRQWVDGVMLGREVYHNPYILAQVDECFYGDLRAVLSRQQVLEQFLPFVEQQLSEGLSLGFISRHIMGLFQGLPGARAWRRYLSDHAHKKGADCDVLLEAAKRVS